MQIVRIYPVGVQVNHRGDWIFLRVETDEGITGLGEASHSSNDALLYQTVAVLADLLSGADPTNISALRQRMQNQRMGRVGATAWSAVEQACQDIRGQTLGVPLYRLLGGAVHDRLRLYANINRHVVARTPDAFARAAAEAVAEGFTAIKLAPFDEVAASVRSRSSQQAAWHLGVERVRAVRSAVGDGIEVAVDCHSRFDVKETLAVAHALEELDLFWFEEPVGVQDLDGLSTLRAQIRQPLATAESLFGADAFHRVMASGAADVVMPDVKHAGGIQEMLAIGEIATACHVGFAPHNPSGPVATVASGHAAACVAGFRILEYAWGEAAWRAELLDPPEDIRDGYLFLSDRPGLGHRLNEEIVRKRVVVMPSSADSSKARP